MLELTTDATQMIEQILEQSDAPDGSGIRIAASEASRDGNSAAVTNLEMSIATGPETADLVIEDAGARVFVEDQVSEFLADKTLDAAVDGQQVQFRLGDQA